MAYYDIPTRAPQVTDEEAQKYQQIMREFGQHCSYRAPFEKQWEDIARILLPHYSGTFTFGGHPTPGSNRQQDQIDSTAQLALGRFGAICNSLLTPGNMRYQKLQAKDPELRKIRSVRLWFDQVTDILFEERNEGYGNFSSQNHNNFLMLGAFGHQYMYVDDYVDPITRVPGGTRYRSCPPGELYLVENHQGVVVGFDRWFRQTAQQAVTQFGIEKLPESLWTSLRDGSPTQYDFLQHVCLRKDYDPERLDARAMPYSSTYVCVQGSRIVEESGFFSFPLPGGRWMQVPGEVNGRGPASMVLGSMKTSNLQKKVFLKQGHRASDPILLTSDDGLIDLASLKPGTGIPGAVNADGRPLVHILPSGDIAISKEMLEMEANLQNDAFLVTLFQILTETPQMTAREVIERTNEKGILLAPTIGRQQSEYINPLTHRELDILSRQGRLPPLPPELKEAGADYRILSTSPMSKAMRAQEIAGVYRSLEHTRELVAITQDLSLLDPYDMDTIVIEGADIEGAPERFMSSPQSIAQKRKARQAREQQQLEMQMLPAKAAMMKAQADVQAKTSGQAMGSGALQPAPQGTPRFRGPV